MRKITWLRKTGEDIVHIRFIERPGKTFGLVRGNLICNRRMIFLECKDAGDTVETAREAGFTVCEDCLRLQA